MTACWRLMVVTPHCGGRSRASPSRLLVLRRVLRPVEHGAPGGRTGVADLAEPPAFVVEAELVADVELEVVAAVEAAQGDTEDDDREAVVVAVAATAADHSG